MSIIRIRLLGPPAVDQDGHRVEFNRRKVLALLAYLAATGRAHGRDALTELLYPGQPRDRARSNFRHTLSILAAAVGKEALDISRSFVGLHQGPSVEVDVQEFDRLVRALADSTAEDAEHSLQEMSDLYGGDFLDGFYLRRNVQYENWQLGEQNRLFREYESGLERLAAIRSQRGDHCGAASCYRRLVGLDPLNEDACRKLMRVYDHQGKHGAAMQLYRTYEATIARELGSAPEPETVGLARETLAQRVDSDQAESTQPGGPALPACPTSFVGREDLLRSVADLLCPRSAGGRLVTLTGPPGTGKTRLSLEIARKIGSHFADGVRFVDLAPSRHADDVADGIVAVMHLRGRAGGATRPIDLVIGALSHKTLLLVLDNFEHLLDAGPAVRHMVERCPGLSVLVTSREALAVQGEVERQVDPLSVVSGDAAQLFRDRMAAVEPVRAVPPRHLVLIEEICSLLDGLPLAIELAAQRLRSMSLPELRDRLASGYSILSRGGRDLPHRQQTLHREIEWSYDLLEPDERFFFGNLTVFVGGWDIDAACSVCTEQGRSDVCLDLLDSLLRKNMIYRDDTPDKARYRMLATIREFGEGVVVRRGGDAMLRERHARHYLLWAEKSTELLHGPDQIQLLSAFDVEQGNLRASLEWCLAHEMAEEMLRLATALSWYWYRSGKAAEGLAWFARGLCLDGADPDSHTYAWAMHAMGWMRMTCGDWSGARKTYENALDSFRRLGNLDGEAWSLSHLGTVERWLGAELDGVARSKRAIELARKSDDPHLLAHSLIWAYATTDGRLVAPGQREELEECYRVAVASGDFWAMAHALQGLGDLNRESGSYQEARNRYGESLVLFRDLQDRWQIAWDLSGLGRVSLREEKFDAAREHIIESIALFRALGDESDMAFMVGFLALAEHALGHAEHVAEMLGAVSAWQERTGIRVTDDNSFSSTGLAKVIEQCRREWANDWNRGRLVGLGEVVAF